MFSFLRLIALFISVFPIVDGRNNKLRDVDPVKKPTTKPVQSQPIVKPVSNPVNSPVAAPYCPPPLPICQFAGYCRKDSDCRAGNFCRLDQLPYYTQCLPLPSSYKTSQCLANFYGNNSPCTKDSDCCDPGAICNLNYGFRQCQQPYIGSTDCLSPSGFLACPTPTNKPSFKPSLKPSFTPTLAITIVPSDVPTDAPSDVPTYVPTA